MCWVYLPQAIGLDEGPLDICRCGWVGHHGAGDGRAAVVDLEATGPRSPGDGQGAGANGAHVGGKKALCMGCEDSCVDGLVDGGEVIVT